MELEDRLQLLDIEVLRLVVAERGGRLDYRVSLGYAVVAAQLAELVIAGQIRDDNDCPVIVSEGGLSDRDFNPLMNCLRELRGVCWQRIFWQNGVDSPSILNDCVDLLVDSGMWSVENERRLLRKARPTRTELSATPSLVSSWLAEGQRSTRDLLDPRQAMIFAIASRVRRKRDLLFFTKESDASLGSDTKLDTVTRMALEALLDGFGLAVSSARSTRSDGTTPMLAGS